MRLRVLIADDQEMIRAGLRKLLENEPDLDVVGEARDGAEGVRLAANLRPDVVLMDIRMPILDGIAATRQITTAGLARVLVLTTYDLDDYVYQALVAGASGFLLKDSPPERLREAVRIVGQGDALVEPAVLRRLIGAFTPPRSTSPDSGPMAALTPREREVLVLVARGRSNAEIAAELVLSEATVRTHVGHVLTKLAARDRTQAVIAAYEHGLVAPGDATRGWE